MLANQISGYVQIVIGAVGIIVTILAAPQALDAASRIRAGEGLPEEFAGAAGAVRVFSITFALVMFTFLVGLGVAVTLSQIAQTMGAAWPMLVSSLLVGTLTAASATATFAIYRSPLAAPAFLVCSLLAILATQAGLSPTLDRFWDTVTAGVMLILASCLGVILNAAGFFRDRGP